jgi:hypothetical protein
MTKKPALQLESDKLYGFKLNRTDRKIRICSAASAKIGVAKIDRQSPVKARRSS